LAETRRQSSSHEWVTLSVGKIISPLINYFPGGKKAIRFIYKDFQDYMKLVYSDERDGITHRAAC